MEMKECTCCGYKKTLDAFHLLKTGKYGRHANCKECRSEKRKKLDYKKPTTGQLKCLDCEMVKDVNEFSADKTSSTGCQTYCKICQKERIHEYISTLDGYISCLFKDLKKNAKTRNIKVDIKKEDIYQLYEKQDGLCAITKDKMTHVRQETGSGRGKRYLTNISVDRIDSSKHYKLDNIHLVCSIINTIKWDMPLDEFVKYCRKVAQYEL